MSAPLSFFARYVLALKVYFKLLFDGEFAARVQALYASAPPALPPAPEPEPAEKPRPAAPQPPANESALLLLGLLQREGRLVDFLRQDVSDFPDADVGAAARVVHDGCRKALADHSEIQSVRAEEEGSSITLEEGYDARAIKLTGNVGGKPPYKGALRHRGWRVTKLTLPAAVGDADLSVVAPAEVEL